LGCGVDFEVPGHLYLARVKPQAQPAIVLFLGRCENPQCRRQKNAVQEAEEAEAAEGPVGKTGVCDDERHPVVFCLMHVFGPKFAVYGNGHIRSNA